MRNFVGNRSGFTLVEVVISIIIAGILAAVALRAVSKMSEVAKAEETKQELQELEFAIIGNSKFYNDNTRSNFGYVGDVGSLPPNLDALFSNPGGFATWRGPYIMRSIEQDVSDYKTDAWGSTYTYGGGVTIISTGSGSDIVRTFGSSPADFLTNGVDGVVLDKDGTPPGTVFRDSIFISLTIPNGSGGMTTLNSNTDMGGYFSFNSVPIGNHSITIIYSPTADTLTRFVNVLPKSRHYGEYFLFENVWADSSGS